MTTETRQHTPLYDAAVRECDRAVERARQLQHESGFADNGWAVRHRDAFTNAPSARAVAPRRYIAQSGITYLIRAWLIYGDAHQSQYGSTIGEDGVLGDEWARIGYALRGLLNGELGDLDGGTTDAIIVNALRSQGFDPDTEARLRDEPEPAREPDMSGHCLCHDAAVCPDDVVVDGPSPDGS